ncbi:hypothetical protein ASG71_00340 [Arthrobacter sp. Soil763]|nr:hypothetical protein ASG71_00340 [Arthrobacter sp. Soil763]
MDSASGSGLNARPHCRRKAIPKAANNTLPTPLASSVLCRRRTITSATHATYATAAAARKQRPTVSCSVAPVSASSATAATEAPMAILPLIPMWRM